MKKIYVLDTNVLLHDPQAIFRFEDNDVVVPLTVIEELDRFKVEAHSEKGRNARMVSRSIDKMRSNGGVLTQGVELEGQGGAIFKILATSNKMREGLPPELVNSKNDNDILGLAKNIDSEHKTLNKKTKVVLVTLDTNLRIKADALGISSEEYKAGKVLFDDFYTGHMEFETTPDNIDEFYTNGIKPETLDVELFPNQLVTLTNNENSSQAGIGRYFEKEGLIKPLLNKKNSEDLWSLKPRNREQHFALDLLLDKDIDLVTLVGKAGTGKTLLAIAAGLAMTADEQEYNRVLISRPVFPMGKDIGFLPGDIDEKLAPWMQPIFDNIDFLLNGVEGPDGKSRRGYQELMDLGIVDIEALTYIRGRSIPKQYMIVDEAQNLTPHEVKTIITRAGLGTKIILTGDPEQIDNPYVDAASNGLSYVVEKFKNHSIAGHIVLSKGERSPLAELATHIL